MLKSWCALRLPNARKARKKFNMKSKPEKGKASAAQTAEASSVQTPLTKERTEQMDSTQHAAVTPILFFGQDEFQLRAVIGDNGEPLFIAADACQALDLANVTQALSRLDDDEQALILIKGLNRGNDLVNVVTEPGLYSLILGSRKPETKRFKRWVTHEVLPSIRKTGSYSAKSHIQLDRQKRFCRTLMVDISKCEDPFGRDGLVQLAEVAFPEIGLKAPSRALLRPLQMPIGWEGGAA